MDRLCELGGPALVEAVDRVEDGTFAPEPQPEQGVSLAPKIGDADRVLDTGLPAVALADRIRALSPHVGVRCAIDGESFKVWRARPTAEPASPGLSVREGRLLLGCADASLEILELQPPSKARMPAAAFLRGWRGALVLS
jgi:methionyl-tRNA formyltransferase